MTGIVLPVPFITVAILPFKGALARTLVGRPMALIHPVLGRIGDAIALKGILMEFSSVIIAVGPGQLALPLEGILGKCSHIAAPVLEGEGTLAIF